MAAPYVGEIRMFAGNFAPLGWAFCDGSPVLISDNETLFQIIGTTYGGDGESYFALPNLQSRMPLHMGQGPGLAPYQIGEMAGVESVTLTTAQMPTHSHPMLASEGAADQTVPSNNLPGEASKRFFLAPGSLVAMSANSMQPTGGSQPHENLHPYAVVNFIISLYGFFPVQN